MQFLKKHYEKILLTVILAGLLGAAGFLLVQVNNAKEELIKVKEPLNPDTKGGLVKVLNTNDLNMKIERAAKPVSLDLSRTNHVFNPLTWKAPTTNQTAIVKADDLGPNRLNILSIKAMSLVIDVSTGPPDRPNLSLGVTKEYEKPPKSNKRSQRSAVLNTLMKLDGELLTATVKEVTGEGEVAKFTVDLKIGTEVLTGVVITKAAPFRKVVAYSVDMEYPPGKSLPLLGKREGDEIVLDGESYNLVAIKEQEVIVESKSNKKPWTIAPKPSR